MGSYRGLLGRTPAAAGPSWRGPDYERIAAQTPGDPWAWLALGWLAGV